MSDLIERQKAIDALKDWYDGMIISSFRGVEKVIKAIPSAQPEIIRCRDCRNWSDCDESCLINNTVWYDADEFCSKAERKTDEGD